MESTSEMETALQFYEAARDNLSLVRVYCYCGNLEKVYCVVDCLIRGRSAWKLAEASRTRVLSSHKVLFSDFRGPYVA